MDEGAKFCYQLWCVACSPWATVAEASVYLLRLTLEKVSQEIAFEQGTPLVAFSGHVLSSQVNLCFHRTEPPMGGVLLTGHLWSHLKAGCLLMMLISAPHPPQP